MKKLTNHIALAFALLLLAGSVFAQTGNAPLAGVWKYEVDGREGIAIFSPTHFIWVITDKNRQKFDSMTPAVSEKARAYEALNAAAGIWELESDSRAKSNFLYASNPERNGNFVRYDFEVVGDEFTYWIIQPDGSRGYSGKYRKLADWGAPSEMAQLNGVWEFVGPKGIFIQAGNYSAELILTGEQAAPTTDEAKAQNFDAVMSFVFFGTQVSGNRHAWNVFHSGDIRQEKATFFTDCEMPNPDLVNMWMVDAQGKKLGEGWQTRRIGR